MRRIIQLFHQRDARDELGIGAIRDSIADHMFPGTSTIQTRLRYFLFVPWIFWSLEQARAAPSTVSTRLRESETALIDALVAGNERGRGVIGVDARQDLQRLPSAIYWAGLKSWGLRRFPGSLEAYLREYGNLTRQAQGEEKPASWQQDLPDPPDKLFKTATFALRADEARFLRQRIVESNPASVLAALAHTHSSANVDFIWHHPDVAALDQRLQTLIDHGRVFSLLIEGAVYLYNLMVAEKLGRQEAVDAHGERLEKWREQLDLADIRSWSMISFWNTIEHPNHTITPKTVDFVERWREIVIQDSDVYSSRAARELISTRERRKGPQSRLHNVEARARWGGASQIGRLNFRWTIARGYLEDLAEAQA